MKNVIIPANSIRKYLPNDTQHAMVAQLVLFEHIQDLANLASPKNTVSVTHEHVAVIVYLNETNAQKGTYFLCTDAHESMQCQIMFLFDHKSANDEEFNPHRSEPLITMMRRC